MYEAYTKEIRKLEEMLDSISAREYGEARQMAAELYHEIKDTWNHHLSKKFKDNYCKEFSQSVIKTTVSSLKLYFADKDISNLRKNFNELRKKLKDFRNSDTEIIQNPQSAQIIRTLPPIQKSTPRTEERTETRTPDRETEPEAETAPKTVHSSETPVEKPALREQYFLKTKLAGRLKHFFFLERDRNQQELMLNQKIRMIIMIEPNLPEESKNYYKVFLFNEYQFQRKDKLFQNAVYYEHIYHPHELEFVSDSPVTEDIRKRIRHIFSSGTGGTTNDYGLYIRLYPDTLKTELKRKGDIVSLNAADNPYMVNAKHEIEILPQSCTETELRFEQQIYFDTNSGHKTTGADHTGENGADVKLTFLLSLLV